MLGLKLSPALKVSGAEDRLRKRILREAALRIGLPKPLVFKAKKSTQYGSGVHKALTQLASEMDATPRTLLHRAYQMFLKKVRGVDSDGADGILPVVEN